MLNRRTKHSFWSIAAGEWPKTSKHVGKLFISLKIRGIPENFLLWKTDKKVWKYTLTFVKVKKIIELGPASDTCKSDKKVWKWYLASYFEKVTKKYERKLLVSYIFKSDKKNYSSYLSFLSEAYIL